jgi:UDP-GlcNAc3NAcA epimerase
MLDNSLFFAEMAEQKSKILEQLSLEKNAFVLCTIHRNDNTDKPEKLAEIFNQLQALSTKHKIKLVLPLHPRTKKNLEQLDENLQGNIRENEHILIIDPVSFLDMILLEKYADVVITDSGGVQKEAYFFGKPCLIIRDETEWSEIVEEGMAHLVQPKNIFETFQNLSANRPVTGQNQLFGDGQAAKKILHELLENSRSH